MATSGQPTISRAINSVLPQLKDGDEFLIVGDGTFNVEFWESLPKHPAIRTWETEFTGFWGNHQRNEAIKQARGDFIIFLDDDDWYLPKALDSIREVCARAPETVHTFAVQGHTGVVKTATYGFPMMNIPIGNGMVAIPNIAGKIAEYPTDTHDHGGDSDSLMIRSTIELLGKLPQHHLILTYAEGGIRGGA